MRFRKKPIEIEAVPVRELVWAAANSWNDLPDYVRDAYERGEIVFGSNWMHIKTLEGLMTGNIEDVLIRGVQGELYPCKDAIFRATYEPVGEP